MSSVGEFTKKRTRSSKTPVSPTKRRKRSPFEEKLEHVHKQESEHGLVQKKSIIVAIQPKVAPVSSHVRFDSEERATEHREIDIPDVVVPYVEETLEEDLNSDDDAPEDVSAVVARQNVEAASAGVAETIKQQQLKGKRKRQEQAARIKEQLTKSRRKLKPQDDFTESKKSPRSDPTRTDDDSDDDDLPELLPEELLAQDFTRAPTPPLSSKLRNGETSQKPQRIKLVLDSPIDKQVGPFKVSILQNVNKFLPPKASSKSRAVREGWLAGRRFKSGKAAERKTFGGGFLRQS